MKDLGKKQKDLYDSPASPDSQRNKMVYPELTIDLSLVEGKNLKVGDTIDLKFKARVSGMQDTKWSKNISFELEKGDIGEDSKSDKSILADA